MADRLTPNYLNTLVPSTVGNSCTCKLRRPNNLRNITCRTNLYSASFLPSVVNDWNSLGDDTKNAESLSAFEYRLNVDKPCPRRLYFLAKGKFKLYMPDYAIDAAVSMNICT